MNWATSSREHVVCNIKHRHTQRSSCQRSPQRQGTAQKRTAGETRREKQRERQGDSLVHPAREWLKGLLDLLLLDQEGSHETDDKKHHE